MRVNRRATSSARGATVVALVAHRSKRRDPTLRAGRKTLGDYQEWPDLAGAVSGFDQYNAARST
jgi:hypothetical protein